MATHDGVGWFGGWRVGVRPADSAWNVRSETAGWTCDGLKGRERAVREGQGNGWNPAGKTGFRNRSVGVPTALPRFFGVLRAGFTTNRLIFKEIRWG